MALPPLASLGVSTPDLVEASERGPLIQATALLAFQQLRDDARTQGFDLRIESGHRSFEKQLSIWNRKARGELPLLDPRGIPMEASTLGPLELMWAILHWSALPGTSRHHWGSDLDVVDASAVPAGYEVQLTLEEVAPDGMFGPMHTWLDQRIATGDSHGFLRPYLPGTGRVQPERWHLSHAPSAQRFEAAFSTEALRTHLATQPMELLPHVLKHLDAIVAEFTLPYFNGPRKSA